MENCGKNCGNFLEEIEFRPMKATEYPLLSDFLYEAIFLPPGVRHTPAQRSGGVAGIAALYCGFWQRWRFLHVCGTRNAGHWCRMVQIFAGIRQCGGYARAGSFPFAVLSGQRHWYSSFGEVFGRNSKKELTGDFSFRSERKSCP